eukprot:scaffold87017_cov17-Tisochrysis_lutea.AAC.1
MKLGSNDLCSTIRRLLPVVWGSFLSLGVCTVTDGWPAGKLAVPEAVAFAACTCRSYDGEADVPKAFKARMSQVSAGQQNKPSKQKSLLGSLAR